MRLERRIVLPQAALYSFLCCLALAEVSRVESTRRMFRVCAHGTNDIKIGKSTEYRLDSHRDRGYNSPGNTHTVWSYSGGGGFSNDDNRDYDPHGNNYAGQHADGM